MFIIYIVSLILCTILFTRWYVQDYMYGIRPYLGDALLVVIFTVTPILNTLIATAIITATLSILLKD